MVERSEEEQSGTGAAGRSSGERGAGKAYGELGSVSSGTMRPEDLIATFGATLWELDNAHAALPADDWEERPEEWDDVVEGLFDALDAFAPPYCYFGSHEGDGADYGFWVSWESIDDAVADESILKIDSGEMWVPAELAREIGLSSDCPVGVIADWLEENDRPEKAEFLRRLESADYVVSVHRGYDTTLYTTEGVIVWSV